MNNDSNLKICKSYAEDENREWQKNIDNYLNKDLIVMLEDLNFLTTNPIAEELIGYKYTQLIYELIEKSDNDNFFKNLEENDSVTLTAAKTIVKKWSDFYNTCINLLEEYEEKSWLYTTNINEYNNGDILTSNTEKALNLFKFLEKNIKTIGISRFVILLIKIRLVEKEIFIKNKTIKKNKIDYWIKYIIPLLISSLGIIAAILLGVYA